MDTSTRRVSYLKLLWGLCLALACSVIISIALAALVLNNATYFVNPLSPSIPGCPILLPSGVWMVYISPVIYEFLVFILTFWKIWKMNKEHNVTPLAQRLARNGTLYFALLLAVVTVVCVGGATDSVDFAFSGSGIAGALSSVVCSRMALSLHVFSQSSRQNCASARSNPEFVVEQNASIPLGCVSLKGGSELEP
ncbi:unnamed protein product [Rhizoctonia solani]|uniref:Uncharacterized protein n=1 Tax=Rhizoctonia solani TaxID=456999 RepID=A0A8H3CI95_9AGAM|nr:unnamed protein product [Rhizoctonia solani]